MLSNKLVQVLKSKFPILPTIAYHFFSWTDSTDSPDCLLILLSISAFSLYSSCSPLLLFLAVDAIITAQ